VSKGERKDSNGTY
jgi:tRNA A-37 threonylcarbamoyl transferase component Bud32